MYKEPNDLENFLAEDEDLLPEDLFQTEARTAKPDLEQEPDTFALGARFSQEVHYDDISGPMPEGKGKSGDVLVPGLAEPTETEIWAEEAKVEL